MLIYKAQNDRDFDNIFPLLEMWRDEMGCKTSKHDIKSEYDRIINQGCLYYVMDNNKAIGLISGLAKDGVVKYNLWDDVKSLVGHMWYVHPEWRGKGVSKSLVHMLEKYAIANDCKNIIITPNRLGGYTPEAGKQCLTNIGYEFLGYRMIKEL